MSGRLTYRPFESLVKITIEEEKTNPEPELTDIDYFAAAMERVREIREFREIPYSVPSVTAQAQSPSNDLEAQETLVKIIAGKSPIEIRNTQEYVEWAETGRGEGCNPAARKDLLNRLHRGVFSVQDYVDLHGYTLEEAEIITVEFIVESVRRRFRCVKIIHGRGLRSPSGPVLKDALIKWLTGRMRKHIKAFATARGCDGGLGAVYVLLK
ncbi:Smr/MutS family protein [Candidatus Magnetominusculus xianensis]|uniref:Smr protein/MutS2-like protein n=1 Tax=Candidatus Magnetominusculus xianensis TaxID=1748249 RepID=A0ABR5SIH3_9BACT|nr:Smr/MutS family protein [Candidatus Magnetominusculus xianensis]KWT92700.1 Smr protein/MutS2-like protein [Candidatus Magnetominusculus xianensis]MBF0403749.1 Smr/MutS family protein [Nitrospirota bacterium]